MDIERLKMEAGIPAALAWSELVLFAALVRSEALEEAAKVCDDMSWDDGACAAAIRVLKEAPI